MELKLQNCCQTCGGTLSRISDTQWKCDFCKNIHNDVTVQKHVEELKDIINSAKMEKLSNLRRNLYNALNAQYLSSQEIKSVCYSIKEMLPDDFQACFYYDACTLGGRQIADRIGSINVNENVEVIEQIVIFLLKSIQEEFLLDLADLIEKAFKLNNRLDKYVEYSTRFSREAEKVQSGIYETAMPRDVFVAYSSKDMNAVKELVRELEASGMSCFVAARNLRHGKGSVENYNKAIYEAIDNCRSFVFVSSPNSRSFTCDALRIEMPYVMGKDIANAPGNLRNNYSAIPEQYKKCRVEYRIAESKGSNPADRKVDAFFDGYERVYSSDEVAMRVSEHIMYVPEFEETSAVHQAEETKICVECGAQVPVNVKFCSECGKSEFVNTVSELIQYNNRKAERERAEREAVEKAGREREEKDRLEREAAEKAKREREEKERLEREAAEKAKREREEKERLERRAFDHSEQYFSVATCHVCGGKVDHIFDGHYKCAYCGTRFSDKNASTPFPSAQEIYTRALNHFKGNGIAQDYNEAARLFKIAANMNHLPAQSDLGFCYKYGHGVEKNYTEALKWFRSAADKGYALAQNNLGTCYEKGHGVEQSMTEAIKWYRKAAEGGLALAQNNLAFCYINGNGVPQDYTEAVKWLKLSVAQGNAAAQCSLGLRYFNGQGVEQDHNEAIRLFMLSADQGDSNAENNIGYCYETGRGLPRDREKAIQWYKKAAAKGNTMSKSALQKLGIQ